MEWFPSSAEMLFLANAMKNIGPVYRLLFGTAAYFKVQCPFSYFRSTPWLKTDFPDESTSKVDQVDLVRQLISHMAHAHSK